MDIESYFKKAIESGASDLHLIEGSIPSLRINGELKKIGNQSIPFGELRYSINSLIDKNTKDRFEANRDIDLSLEYMDNRFRINLHFQKGKIGLSARLVPKNIPKPDEILFNDTIYRLTHLRDGLILVTGPSGAGKSTTLACMIDIINTERRAHIITIEDPIEYVFSDKQSIIEQRQLGRDTESFASALKYALRQDPNVIMVGEMRDFETINAALTAAKTGHLVLSTLHTSTASETIERILDYFPVESQIQVAHQLSSILRAVITQQLLPTTDGQLVVAREILINTTAVANLIRSVKLEQIYSAMENGQPDGMITMNNSIDELYRKGLISTQVAKNQKRDLGTKASYY
jgi:twitching motility protein PilT